MIAALSFYALAPLGGYNMMLVSWLLLWIMLAALQTYLDGRLDVAKAVGRGIITSIAAAVGFAVVLFQLYRGWPPETFSVFRHFVAWSMAYLPGLYVLVEEVNPGQNCHLGVADAGRIAIRHVVSPDVSATQALSRLYWPQNLRL